MFIICGWGRSEGVDAQHWWTNFIVLVGLLLGLGATGASLGQMSPFSPQIWSVQYRTQHSVLHSYCANWLTDWLPDVGDSGGSMISADGNLDALAGNKTLRLRQLQSMFWLLRWTTCSSLWWLVWPLDKISQILKVSGSKCFCLSAVQLISFL